MRLFDSPPSHPSSLGFASARAPSPTRGEGKCASGTAGKRHRPCSLNGAGDAGLRIAPSRISGKPTGGCEGMERRVAQHRRSAARRGALCEGRSPHGAPLAAISVPGPAFPGPRPVHFRSSARRLNTMDALRTLKVSWDGPVQRSTSRKGRNAQRAGSPDLPGACLRRHARGRRTQPHRFPGAIPAREFGAYLHATLKPAAPPQDRL